MVKSMRPVSTDSSCDAFSLHAVQESIESRNLPGFWLYSAEQNAFLLDAACASILEIGPGGIWYPTEEVFRHYSAEDNDIFQRFAADTSSGDVLSEELNVRYADGRTRPVLISGSVLKRDADGRAQLVTGYLSRTTFHGSQFAYEVGSDGAWDWDGTSDRVRFSASYVSMLGYASSADIASTFEEWADRIVHPEDRATTASQQRQILSCPDYGDYFECCVRLKHAGGHYLWTLGRGLVTDRNREGKAIRIIGTNTNLSVIEDSFIHVRSRLFTDSLTGLLNRDCLLDRIPDYEKPEYQPLSIIYADVAGLKIINDFLGHSAGDQLLIDAGSVLKHSIHKEHESYHIAGDEFLVVLPHCSLLQCQMIISSVSVILRERMKNYPDKQPVMIDMGGATLGEAERDNFKKMLDRADLRMQELKTSHRSQSLALLKEWIENARGEKIVIRDERKLG